MARYRAFLSGNILEIYKYEKNIIREDDVFKNGGRKKADEKEEETERKEEYTLRTNMNARNKIRRRILANFNENSLMITLTYADIETDTKKASNDRKKFMQKLKRMYADFKAIGVIEWQKRGAIHYHIICNIPHDFQRGNEKEHKDYYTYEKGKTRKSKRLKEYENMLSKKWGQGLVLVSPLDNVDNVGAYLIKYLTKDMIDKRLEGVKRHFKVGDVIEPKELEGEELLMYLNTVEGRIPDFTSDYENEYIGGVNYREYNFNREMHTM